MPLLGRYYGAGSSESAGSYRTPPILSAQRQLSYRSRPLSGAPMIPDTDPTGQYGSGLYGAGSYGSQLFPAPAPPVRVTVPPQTDARTAAARTASASKQQQQAPAETAASTFDYSFDPILRQVLAAGEADERTARARAVEEQKRALQAWGSRQAAAKLFGDDPWVQTVSDDPATSNSTLAQLARRYSYDPIYGGLGYQLIEGLNRDNLFYSGFRNLEQARLERARTEEEAVGAQALQSALAQINDALLAAMAQIRDRKLMAEEAAYMRALQAAQNAAPPSPKPEETGSDAETAPPPSPPPGGIFFGPAGPEEATAPSVEALEQDLIRRVLVNRRANALF